VSLPAVGYRLLLPALPEFTARYTDITLDLNFSDRMVDVIEEDLDAVVQCGGLRDSRLQARLLGHFRWVIVGRHARLPGAPGHAAAAARPAAARLPAMPGGFTRFVTTSKLEDWRVRVDQGDPAGPLPGLPAQPAALATGALQAVLADYLQYSVHFSVVWQAHRQVLPRLRVWLDFL